MAEPRRKRKSRGSEAAAASGAGAASNGNGAAHTNGAASQDHRPSPRERMKAGYAKAEVRNQQAREALEPLAEGERPPVVTFSAVLSALVVASILITFALGVKVNGSVPKLNTILLPVLILGVLAWGMWKARYWAVVCFQIVLVFLIFTAVYGLMVEATSVAEISASVGLLAVSGVLFWMMVKAMARIQMPDRLPPQQ
ncbi:MAG TPA: hypothetical protein VN671_04680 [Solirubrobacterales bacterium]|nr:hypothetical protein [Solirubrobacterales bacterium]